MVMMAAHLRKRQAGYSMEILPLHAEECPSLSVVFLLILPLRMMFAP